MKRWASVAGFLVAVAVSNAHAQPAEMETAREMPAAAANPAKAVCEPVMAELSDGTNALGLVSGCWTGRHLYLPADSLAAKLGLKIERGKGSRRSWSDSIRLLSVDADTLAKGIEDEPTAYLDQDLVFLQDHWLEREMGVDIQFLYRDMRVLITAENRFPITQRRLREMRPRPKALETASPPHTHPRRRLLMHPGMLHWNLNAYRNWSDGAQKSVGYTGDLSYGTELLGGGLFVQVPFRDTRRLLNEQLSFQWRWDVAGTPALRHISVGDHVGHLQNFVAVQGLRISNRPAAPRLTYHPAVLSGRIPEEWELEVYRGSQWLAWEKYAETPAYHVELPLNYGQNDFLLRWYSPYGLEREERRTFIISPDQLPPGTFEYVAEVGALKYAPQRYYASVATAYGLSSHLSTSFDVWHLENRSGAGAGKSQAARAGLSWSGWNTMLIKGELSSQGSYQVALSASSIPNAYTHARVIRRSDDPIRDLQWRGMEYHLSHSQGFRTGTWSWNASVAGSLQQYPNHQFRQSFAFLQTSRGRWVGRLGLEETSFGGPWAAPERRRWSMYLHRDIVRRVLLSASSAWDSTLDAVDHVEGRIGYDTYQWQLSLAARYDGWARGTILFASVRARLRGIDIRNAFNRQPRWTTLSTSAGGSVAYAPEVGSLRTDHHVRYERSGAVVAAFWDKNANGKRDAHEPLITGLRAQIGNGGRSGTHQTSMTWFDDLVAFQTYDIEILDGGILPPYTPALKHIRFTAEPNRYTVVHVPVVTAKELIIRLRSEGLPRRSDLGGIRLTMVCEQNGEEIHLISYTDGVMYAMHVRSGTWRLQWHHDDLIARGFEAPEITLLQIADDGSLIQELEVLLTAN